MASPKEESRRFELNPGVIHPEAVKAVMTDLTGEPGTYLKTLRNKRIAGTDFTEIIDTEFQIFRIGILGFELQIAPEDRDRYGITLESISSLGREDIKVPEDQDIGYDDIEGINTMRAFVASAFFEEAAMQKLPTPRINNRLIDPPPAKRAQIYRAVASKPEMFLYEQEEFEERWKEENPDLYQAAVQLKDRLTDYYAGRMIATYQDLPEDYINKVTPDVRRAYSDYLMEYALRTYAMFTPRPPTLIEVKNVKPREDPQ